jgi:hypothetical protein
MICICRFVNIYQKTQRINGYFSNAIFYNTANKIFGTLQYIGDFSAKEYEKLSTDIKMDNIFILNGGHKEEERREKVIPVSNNNIIITYAQIIKNNHLSRIYNGNGSNNDPNTHHKNDPKELITTTSSVGAWKPLSEHILEQSLWYPIIGKKTIGSNEQVCYYCKIHPEVWNIYIESIEHHCKYKEPDKHKAEILRLLKSATDTC